MKEKILISVFDMEIGGVERSLINLLNNLDYERYDVDLMIFSHTGDFMKFIPSKVNILPENPYYKTFRLSICEIFSKGHCLIAVSRLLSKIKASLFQRKYDLKEGGIAQMQYMWEYAIKLLPALDVEYDIAISYLWPHYFVANKVKARKKIAWIHTDYSTLETDVEVDLKNWKQFDHLVAVSQDVKRSFLKKYSVPSEKIKVIENINAPNFIKKMSTEEITDVVFNENLFNIVSVGRLSHAKGFDNAVLALKHLYDRGIKDIKWYVVGYGGDESLITELINKHGLQDKFILVGKRINPYPFMKNCDLYVQPSRYEGKAVTVSEAKILEKPIVITNYETANSQIIHGKDGIICNLSVEGIADGVEELYYNEPLRRKLEDYCKQNDYSNSTELDKLYELFV